MSGRAAIAVGLALSLVGCDGETRRNCLCAPPPDDRPVDTSEPTVDLGPIALCSVDNNPVQPPDGTARFDGSASYDPNDRAIVAREWTLTQAPDGNAVALSARTGMDTAITPQLVGSYRVDLHVQNDVAMYSDEPCAIVIDAVPDQRLHVELFWSHSGDDLDLHLVRPGAELFSDGDCYAPDCKGTLHWGDPDLADDNPTLVLDDAEGVGPEIIQLPEPEAGVYTIAVHDNADQTRVEPTEATVNIWWDGELVFNDTRRIEGESSNTVFGSLDTHTGRVDPLP